MPANNLEQRVAALEAEVVEIKKRLPPQKALVDVLWGAFKGDPAFEEAMRLGKKWRDSFRPKSRKRKRAGNGRTGQRSRKSA
jgi:hypothetical protein